MPGRVLTTGSQIQCPHGGRAILITSDILVRAATGNVLLETDIDTVAGCPFMLGTKPSPCVRIDWKAGATRANSGGTPILLESSVGTCYSPEGAPQGVAVVVTPETKVTAQ